MAIKSLISQARQVRASETYKDINYVDGLQGPKELAVDIHTPGVAEGTTFLEEDINYIRTQLNDIVGKTNWFDETSISLEELSAIGTKLVIQPVQVAGALTMAAGSVNLTSITSGTAANQSGTNLGYIFDVPGTATVDTKAKVYLRDKVTNMPIVDADESSIYGILAFDGADGDAVTGGAGGLLSIKTYKDVDGVSTAVTYNGEVEAIIPQRVLLSDTNETFAMINAGFAGSVGAIEIGDRQWVALDPTTGLYNLITESGDNTDLSITKDTDLTSVINALVAKSSDAEDKATAARTIVGYTQGLDGVLNTDLETEWDGDGVSTFYLDYDNGAGTTDVLGAVKVLDNTLKGLSDLVEDISSNVQVEILAADLAEGTDWTIPNAVTVVLADKDAANVYVNGMLLSSDFAISGVAGDGSGDYTVSSTTTIAFNFPLIAGDIISIDIKKES